MTLTEAPKFAVDEEFTVGKVLWKVTTVYGYRETYGGNLYAAVRWIKKTQKWSGNAYLHTERRMVKVVA
jgi:hypothetical protein